MDDKMDSGHIWMNVDKWCVTIFIYNKWRYDSWMKTIYCSFLCTSVVIKELFRDENILLVALEALALNMLVTIAVVHIGNLKTLGVFFYIVMHAGLGWYLCSESWGLTETTGHKVPLSARFHQWVQALIAAVNHLPAATRDCFHLSYSLLL